MEYVNDMKEQCTNITGTPLGQVHFDTHNRINSTKCEGSDKQEEIVVSLTSVSCDDRATVFLAIRW